MDILKRAEGLLFLISLVVAYGVLVQTNNSVKAAIESAKAANESVVLANESVEEASMARTMSLRTELYENERWWIERMAQYPACYGVLMSSNSLGAQPKYVENCIRAVTSGRSKELAIPQAVYELQKLLWGVDSFIDITDDERIQLAELRRAYDIAEVMFYHMERIHFYYKTKIMNEEEADTWLVFVQFLGPNPLLLVAAEDARSNGFGDLLPEI